MGTWRNYIDSGQAKNSDKNLSKLFYATLFTPSGVYGAWRKFAPRLADSSIQSVRPPFVRCEAELQMTGKVNNRRLRVLKDNTTTVWTSHRALFTL
jgi:hypothetical protein